MPYLQCWNSFQNMLGFTVPAQTVIGVATVMLISEWRNEGYSVMNETQRQRLPKLYRGAIIPVTRSRAYYQGSNPSRHLTKPPQLALHSGVINSGFRGPLPSTHMAYDNALRWWEFICKTLSAILAGKLSLSFVFLTATVEYLTYDGLLNHWRGSHLLLVWHSHQARVSTQSSTGRLLQAMWYARCW